MSKSADIFLSAVLCAGTFIASALPAHAAPIQIEFWEQDGPDQQAVLDELIADFQKTNSGIAVKRTHYETSELRRNYISAAIGGEAPDVVLGYSDNLGVFVPGDLITPIGTITGADYLKGFDPVALSASRFNGGQFLLPDRYGNELCLIINRKLVTKAPETWDELVETGRRLQREGKVLYPLAFNKVEPYFTVPFLGSFGGTFFDNPASSRAKPKLDTPQVAAWCRFLAGLEKDGVVPVTCDYDTASTLFQEGKVPFLLNGPWSFVNYTESYGMDIMIAPIPKVNGISPTPLCAAKGYTVSRHVAGDKAKKNAVNLFLRHMTGKKAQLAMSESHRMMPSLTAASDDGDLLSDPLMRGQKLQLEKAVPMPIIVQMRAVWDAIKPLQPGIFSGKIRPEDAHAKMQKRAEDGIRALGLHLD